MGTDGCSAILNLCVTAVSARRAGAVGKQEGEKERTGEGGGGGKGREGKGEGGNEGSG